MLRGVLLAFVERRLGFFWEGGVWQLWRKFGVRWHVSTLWFGSCCAGRFFFDMSLSVSCIFYWFGSDVVCGRVGISVCVVD